MASNAEDERVSELYDELKAAIESLDDAKVVKLADQILKTNASDADALRCKIVAQIQLGTSFPETSALFGRLDEQGQKEMALEKAYCMYRMGKLEDAQTILDRADPSDRPADYALLQSQILYRQGKFSEAAASFEGVLKTHLKSLEHPSDVRSNVIAAYVSGGRAEQVGKVLENLKISATGAGFEAAFNVACGLLESGRHDEAGVQLEVAARLGREQLMEDDLEEDEIEIDLAPVSTQSAFLLALRGELEASKKALEKIVGNEAIKDPVVLAVAHNNLIAAKARFLDHDVVTGLVKKSSAVNPKDLLRVLERVTEGKGALSLHLPTQLDQRLSERQKCALHCNRALLLILTDKPEDARQLVQAAAARYPTQDLPALLRAALLAREGKSSKALDVLEEFAGKAGGSGDLTEVRLLQLQLALASPRPEDRRRALDLTLGLPLPLRAQPALLATALQLAAALALPAAAESLLQGAVEAETDSSRRAVLFLELADLRAGTGDAAAALDLLERAATESGAPDSVRSAALGRALRLNATSSSFSAATAALPKGLARVAATLPNPTCAVDVTLLEAASKPGAVAVPMTAAQAAAAAVGGSSPMEVDRDPAAEAARRLAKNKRKREKKRDKFLASKGFGDGKKPVPVPDPERWLPKQERSDFKAKVQKRREGPVVKGSQGAGKVDDSLDANRAGPSSGPGAKTAMPSLPGKKKKPGKK